ncbi:hypothetical protein FQN57_004273 [Myotisia sp. PD_48]|nr:hypothetical protein FQN57_004273 [Myotisia sp. PD_48]
MPGAGHEYAAGWLDQVISTRTLPMVGDEHEEDLIMMRSTNVEHKEADCSYQPRTLPKGRPAIWPSVVVEIGSSETHGQLNNDAVKWFRISGGLVKLVITVKASAHRITIVRYNAGGQKRSLRAVLSQRSIAQKTRTGRITITNGPFTIPFQELFLRAPKKGQGDIVLARDDLKDWAECIWRGIKDFKK